MRIALCLTLSALLAGGCAESKSLMDPSETAGLAANGRRTPQRELPAAAAPEAGTVAKVAEGLLSPPPADAPATAPTERRQVIYSATFRVVVADVAASIRSVTKTAEQLGGYMQEVSGDNLTVRVPASKFDEATTAVEHAGEVIDRQLRASDVTEEMHDLQIRLDNAEKLRQRLLDILGKSQKVKDALKVEAELARVSEQIDTAKGRIRYLDSQVAMSTIRVYFNAAAKPNLNSNAPLLPFAWIDELGSGLVAGDAQQSVERVGLFGRGPRFKTPAGFVRYYENKDHAEAMDGNGLLVRVKDHDNVDKAPLTFWSKLVRKSLVENRALSVESEKVEGTVYVLRGQRDVAGKPVAYLLSIERNDKRVIVFEAWGPAAQFKEGEAVLRESALSVEPG